MEKEDTSVVCKRHERKKIGEATVAVIEKEGEGQHGDVYRASWAYLLTRTVVVVSQFFFGRI